ncbi:pleckstrin homology domain-containing family H member 3 [Geospiza fortis]|uniref:Pleckstrin homology domain-containing family H member 3 n=1 Tax=Geospiza fortis TaxID=48883 RepID=A0A8N5HX46_GEOFO|nr:pleckstrin homology domain-containing family H member 3 [Geospiza fortis]
MASDTCPTGWHMVPWAGSAGAVCRHQAWLRKRSTVMTMGLRCLLPPQGSLEVSLSQPTRSSSGSERSLLVAEEMRSLIVEKGPGPVEDEPDALVKGWLQREMRGCMKTPWIRPRKYWFVLTPDSLDYYSSNEKGARRLGSLVLTSLCSVLWPDKQLYKETGYWSVTVFGRKHCYRLYTEHLNEAVRWVCAVQKVIDSKAPVQTPTQLLMRDVEEHRDSPEVLEQIYRCNPILRYTSGPLYAPLLPFPYGSLDQSAPGPRSYTTLRDEAVKLFNSLQQLESERDPVPLMQGVLQTCLDLPPLVDEIYCQLVKQTTEPPAPGGQGDLHYWQLLTCMSCTFLPSLPVLRFLRFHLDRTENRFPASEMAKYACFIREALGKTKGRECVPSLEEILVLMQRQEMICTVHCPGAPACSVAISSHTTAEEVAQELVSRLGLSQSPNLFALYEQSRRREQPVGSATLLADVLTRFENPVGAGPQRLWLGIGAKAVSLYKPGEPEPLDSFCYGRISSFGASDSSTFRLSVEDRDLLFETSQVDEIAQLLKTYLASAGAQRLAPCGRLLAKLPWGPTGSSCMSGWALRWPCGQVDVTGVDGGVAAG